VIAGLGWLGDLEALRPRSVRPVAFFRLAGALPGFCPRDAQELGKTIARGVWRGELQSTQVVAKEKLGRFTLFQSPCWYLVC
jgi:hypothetical protein